MTLRASKYVHTLQDLTEQNLTKIFRHYFQDDRVVVKIVKDNETFIGKNDGYQSEIKKWTAEISGGGEKRELTFIVKTSLQSSFNKINSRLARQFFSETFWYKHALPVRDVF